MLAMAARRIGGAEVGGADLRVAHLPGNAKFQAEVGRAHHQRIDAGHRRDGIGIFHALCRFNHGDDHHAVVAQADRLGYRHFLVARSRPQCRHRTPSERRVFGQGDRLCGIRGGTDVRHDDAAGAGIEHGANGADRGRVHPHQRRDAASAGRHAQVRGFAQRKHAVLAIDVKTVETRFPDDKGGVSGAHLAQRHELGNAPGGEFLLEEIVHRYPAFQG